MKSFIVQLRAWRLRKTVSIAADVLRTKSRASQEDILRALEEAGFSPPVAWHLFQIIPIAVCHVVFGAEGVSFEVGYLSASWKRPDRVRRDFRNDPLYIAAADYAKRLISDGRRSDLESLFSLTAEYAAMIQVRNRDGTFRGIRCTEPILFEYEKA